MMSLRNKAAPLLVVAIALAVGLMALVMSGWGVGVQPAFAAPPTNDDFASATAVTDAGLPFTDSVNTDEATFEGPDEPEPSCTSTGPHTVWYAFTPSVELTVAADTFGSAYDTVLAAYTGPALKDLGELACNDDAFSLQSRVVLTVAAAETVFFQVGGFDTDSGDLVFNLAESGPPLSVSLDPETDSNTVGQEHTVTATVVRDGDPEEGATVVIVVFDGPNAGESAIGLTDTGGQLSLTYTGDGGPGTDSIAAMACDDFDGFCEGVFEGFVEFFVEFCAEFPEDCLFFLEEVCATESLFVCDQASKDWTEPAATPTPTPAPTATPTTTPAVLAATATPTPAALPEAGGVPSQGGSSTIPGLLAIAGALAVMSGGGLWLAHQRRRVR